MSRPTKKPSIPAAKDAFSSSVKQILEIFLGRGDKLDKVLTARDAIEIGFAKLAGAAKSTSETGLVPAGPVLDYTPPPQITGLTAVGGLASITLSWNQLTYANRSHVEVWRADVDDIGQAVLIGTSDASVYPDPIGSGAVKYYWARAVSTADKEGPYNAVAGTRGETGHDPAYVMDLLTSKRWQAATVYSLFQVVAPATPVVKNGITLAFQCTTAGTSGASEPNWNGVSGVGGQIADGTVVWTAVEAGTAPFVIGTINGVNVVAIHGALVVDGTLTGTKIQADAIGAEHISVVNLAAISANLGAITAGSMSINNKFLVDAQGNVTIRSGTTGARLEMFNNVIKVFDANNVLRVQIGDLSA